SLRAYFFSARCVTSNFGGRRERHVAHNACGNGTERHGAAGALFSGRAAGRFALLAAAAAAGFGRLSRSSGGRVQRCGKGDFRLGAASRIRGSRLSRERPRTRSGSEGDRRSVSAGEDRRRGRDFRRTLCLAEKDGSNTLTTPT